jgi:hypothetical protein
MFGFTPDQHAQVIDLRIAELGQVDPALAGVWQDMIADLDARDMLDTERAEMMIAGLVAVIDVAVRRD